MLKFYREKTDFNIKTLLNYEAAQSWLSLWPTDGSPCICSIMTQVSVAHNHKRRTVRLLMQQTRSSTHLCVWSGILFFSGRWLQMMKLGKWGSKTHLQLLIIAIGAAKDNEMKIFEIVTLSLIPFSEKQEHSFLQNRTNKLLGLRLSKSCFESGTRKVKTPATTVI